MKHDHKKTMNWMFTLLLALALMVGMSMTAFADDGQAGSDNAGAEPNDVIRINPGESVDITVADQWTDVVLQVPVLDETAEMHFWTDHVCACATLDHMDGSYYDSGYNGFNLTDTGFQGEYYELHCSVVDGYKDMTYDVHYELNDWTSSSDPAAYTVKGLAVQPKKKSAVVSWTQNNAAAGYVIEYSPNKKFKNAEKKEIMKTPRTSMISMMTIDRLKSNKVYYFRIAPLSQFPDPNTGETATIQGKWSKVVKVKIK